MVFILRRKRGSGDETVAAVDLVRYEVRVGHALVN